MESSDLFLLLGFLVAIGIGWALGRLDLIHRRKRRARVAEDYLKGLNYLLSHRPDDAIEVFIGALDVNADSVETHLVLGRLFRSRGEIDKATAVHQRLLAKESLSAEQSQLAQFELASDYMAAGLLDRAERLLKDITAKPGAQSNRSLELLMEIYQREKEWDQAIEVALALLPKQKEYVAPILAHYFCEAAISSMNHGDLNDARKLLKRALGYDAGCVRASLLLGHLEAQSGRYKEAIKSFQQIKYQDPAYLPESLPHLSNCYHQLGQNEGLQNFLRECVREFPSVSAILSLADIIGSDAGCLQQTQQFVKKELMRRPSLKGVERLLELQLRDAGTPERRHLEELKDMIRLLIDSKPVYRCSQCGYSGKQLTWLCPGCEQWGKIKPIYGLEGE